MDGGGDSMPTTVAGSGVPNEAALLALMEKSGYQMLQENGQRKYGGPPPSWEGPAPLRGCEIFIGKIPRDCYEDELVPVFEKVGKIYELRLMMDFSGSNRGYAFVMYTNKADAVKAVKELNNYEIRKGRLLGVCLSVDNCRLFVGGIPKNKQKDEIHTEMDKVTEGVVDVIVYPSAQDKSKNRGFAFVEYESHRSAAMARRKLIPGRIQLWGHQIAVDWAEPEQEVDEEVMKNVKILYVRNLMLTTTEETLEEVFTKAAGNDGCVERVKKIRDYAFVHFRERQDAITAMHQLNGQLVDNARVEVCLAKPVDKTDYVRYTRGGHAPQFQQGYAGGFEAVPFTGGAPQYYGQFGNMAVGRGFTPAARGGMRPPMMRGRGRGAAGSRAAGGRGGYTHPGFRGKHPAEDRLFNIRPGMKLTPTDPITLKPQSMKSPVQTLEEFCTKNGMGSPVYQLHSAIDRESNGDVQLFLYKVAIPALASTYPNSAIQPPQLCRSVEEAKVYAAEFALGQLGVPMEGNITDVAISPPPGPGVIPASTLGVTSQLTSPTSPLASSTLASSMYQGRPLVPGLPGTGYSLTNATRNDFTFAPSLPVSSYVNVMAPGKIPQNMTSPVAESPPAQYLYSDCMLSPSLGNEMSPSYYGYLASPSVNTALAFNFSHLVTTH